jgi:hypothetical protein
MNELSVILFGLVFSQPARQDGGKIREKYAQVIIVSP